MPQLLTVQQWFLAETPLPTPSMTVDPTLVTPGPAGFAAIAVLGIVVVLLVIDMQRRIRKVRYRSEIEAKLDEELRNTQSEDTSEETAKSESAQGDSAENASSESASPEDDKK